MKFITLSKAQSLNAKKVKTVLKELIIVPKHDNKCLLNLLHSSSKNLTLRIKALSMNRPIQKLCMYNEILFLYK